MPDRTVRLSQTLSPFGVGAIYDFLGESFVAADIRRWRKHSARLLPAPRLAAALGVREFREAPARPKSFGIRAAPGIPYIRFPRWLFCVSCRRMLHWRAAFEVPDEPARCRSCESRRTLIPMRFVTVCREGHLDDVPWGIWAHSRADDPDQKQCQRHSLRFLTKAGAGGGLRSLVVRCDTCRAQRALEGLTAPGSLAQLHLKCRGIQPWQSASTAVGHDEVPEVVQRGATNVYFAHLQSAIDIPPESAFDETEDLVHTIRATPEFEVILGAPDGPAAPHLVGALAASFGVEPTVVESLVRAEIQRRGDAPPPPADADDIMASEWAAFQTPHIEADDRDRFITRHVNLEAVAEDPRRGLLDPLDKVVQAIRLREVRALTGFSRLSPGNPVVPPDLGSGLDWLPALEVFGEGIFISVKEDAVARWEHGPAADRISPVSARRDAGHRGHWLPEATPRFIMLHTLAHLLIRQLAFDSGYASASLTERIYSRLPEGGRPGMAGVLIYTAAGDQEGTLGGLVRQGVPERLMATLSSALTTASWCSSDPICRESTGQGVDALNLAACHACCLIAETSCAYANALLDRGLVVGTESRGNGFFEQPIALVLEGTAVGAAR